MIEIWLLVISLRGTGLGDQNTVVQQFPTQKACVSAAKIIDRHVLGTTRWVCKKVEE